MFDNTPIRQDIWHTCDKCRKGTKHSSTTYTDEQILSCLVCGTRTIIKFEDNQKVDSTTRKPKQEYRDVRKGRANLDGDQSWEHKEYKPKRGKRGRPRKDGK